MYQTNDEHKNKILRVINHTNHPRKKGMRQTKTPLVRFYYRLQRSRFYIYLRRLNMNYKTKNIKFSHNVLKRVASLNIQELY